MSDLQPRYGITHKHGKVQDTAKPVVLNIGAPSLQPVVLHPSVLRVSFTGLPRTNSTCGFYYRPPALEINI